jgi:subfamily B ATP-binding cassette protein MsbA
MDMGTFVVFIIALFKLYDPVRKFAFFYNSFQQAMGASVSIFNFLDIEDDVRERARGSCTEGFSTTRLRLRMWASAYSTEEGELQILHEINLEVRAARCWPWSARAARENRRW